MDPPDPLEVLKTLELRIAGYEYLKMQEQGTSRLKFFGEWWNYWNITYGVPDPPNWDEVADYHRYIADFRMDMVKSIISHSRLGHKSYISRPTRIQMLQSGIFQEVVYLKDNGLDVVPALGAPGFEHLFRDAVASIEAMKHRRRGVA